MKVCEVCGEEIGGRDGDNLCRQCEDQERVRVRGKRAQAKREREECLRSLGLVKVRGALGGVYWE